MIKPTVGRVVYFFACPECPPQAAIIANVFSDTCVNLTIFGHDGNAVADPPTSIRLIQPGEERPDDGIFCEWMPYQVKKPTGSESGEKSAGTKEI